MLSEKHFLQIIAKVCCIFLFLKSIVAFGFVLFLSQQENDWGDIGLELLFLAGSITLAVFWLIALFKDDHRLYLYTIFVSTLPFFQAVFGFIFVLYNKHYDYEAIFIDVGIDREDVPFYSRLLAFIFIALCSVPAVVFLRLWRLTKSSTVPHAVCKSGKELLLTTV